MNRPLDAVNIAFGTERGLPQRGLCNEKTNTRSFADDTRSTHENAPFRMYRQDIARKGLLVAARWGKPALRRNSFTRDCSEG
jgi:hypothetical protein